MPLDDRIMLTESKRTWTVYTPDGDEVEVEAGQVAVKDGLLIFTDGFRDVYVFKEWGSYRLET